MDYSYLDSFLPFSHVVNLVVYHTILNFHSCLFVEQCYNILVESIIINLLSSNIFVNLYSSSLCCSLLLSQQHCCRPCFFRYRRRSNCYSITIIMIVPLYTDVLRFFHSMPQPVCRCNHILFRVVVVNIVV